jgi:flagellar protein FliO/FliZ
MDVIDFGRYFAALLLVAALLGFAWLAARKQGFSGLARFIPAQADRRLSVVETMMMGPKHRLYLLRRDGTEHLVVIGPQGADVIEAGIPATAVRATIEAAP